MRIVLMKLGSAVWTVVLCLALHTPGVAQEVSPFPSESEFSSPKAGDLILRSGVYSVGGWDFEADYGLLAVPENRNWPDSRLIFLPIVRIVAIGEEPLEPVFHLSDGPGQTNILLGDYLESKRLQELPFGQLHERHDFVMVGYRGVDGSVSLDCPEVTEVMQSSRAPLSNAGLANLAEAFSVARGRLVSEGVDIDGYNIVEVIDDLEEARKQLGYERIQLLGEGYGTRVAYLYGLRHPESIRRSLLVGANPPGHFTQEPQMIETQLARYAQLWEADPEFAGRAANLIPAMRRVLAGLPRNYLWMRIDPDRVRIASVLLLANRESAAQVFNAYFEANEGDYAGLAYMSENLDELFSTGLNWGDFISKIASADYDPPGEIETEMMPARAVLGSPLGKLLLGVYHDGVWPITAIPDEYRRLERSRIPTLIVNGNHDFATPLEFAHELLPYLRNGNLVELKEMGHTDDVIYLQHHAFTELATGFFGTGEIDASGFSYEPADFTVETSFREPIEEEMLRYGLIGVGALAVLFVGALAFFQRRRPKPVPVEEPGFGPFAPEPEPLEPIEVTEFVDPRDKPVEEEEEAKRSMD
jgi:pimeloyl-ACP methyl ester carboxylesterase